MAGLMKREHKGESVDVSERFDRMFEDWANLWPFRHGFLGGRDWMPAETIRVEQFRENGNVVIRAELPGIDPEKDVSITVSDGFVNIEAERREEESKEERGYVRRELRYGSFSRSLRLPEGCSEDDVKATYENGMLEIRVPAPKAEAAKKVAISKK